jgi:hypothetical protein
MRLEGEEKVRMTVSMTIGCGAGAGQGVSSPLFRHPYFPPPLQVTAPLQVELE